MRRFASFCGDAFQAEADTTFGLLLAVYIRVALKTMDALEWNALVAVGLSGWEIRPQVMAASSSTPAARWTPGRKLQAGSEKATIGPTLLSTSCCRCLIMPSAVCRRLRHASFRREYSPTATQTWRCSCKKPPLPFRLHSSAAYEEIMRFIHAITGIT